MVDLNSFFPRTTNWQYENQNSNFTAKTQVYNKVNTTGGIKRAILPENPEDNDLFGFVDTIGDGTGTGFGANKLIIEGNGKSINNSPTLELTIDNQFVVLLYDEMSDRYIVINSFAGSGASESTDILEVGDRSVFGDDFVMGD